MSMSKPIERVANPSERRSAPDEHWPALLAAAASVAQDPNIAATVMLERRPGVVALARAAARRAAVTATVEITATTIAVRFAAGRHDGGPSPTGDRLRRPEPGVSEGASRWPVAASARQGPNGVTE